MDSNLNLGIIDYGFCNINSVYSACNDITSNVNVINSADEVKNYEKIILPGVGNFEAAVKKLNQTGFFDSIIEHVNKKRDLLGICLGMQLLFNQSEESTKNINGLGLLSGDVLDLSNFVDAGTPVPHMGWSELSIKDINSKIVNEITEGSSFYFANGYFCNVEQKSIVATFEHGDKEFPAIVSNNLNVFGVQFHPEKSQAKGIQIIQNFLNVKE